jgi:uncharacterized DUF497 family protein
MKDVDVRDNMYQNWDDTDFRLIIGSTGIEYDPTKEEANKRKHGYSLERATSIFERYMLPLGSLALFINEPIERNGEIRHNHLTLYERKVVFIVTTMRPGEKVRVISFRRASTKEIKIYIELCKQVLMYFEKQPI